MKRRNAIATLLGLAGTIAAASFAIFAWPFQSTPDQPISVTDAMLAKLAALEAKPKYAEETTYTGILPLADRHDAETQLNELIRTLRNELKQKPSTKFLFAEFSKALSQFRAVDTEDRERLCAYLEEVMEIVGVDSSHGLLNRWLYGPILGRLLSSRR